MKSYPTIKAAHAAVWKTPAVAVRYSVKLEGVNGKLRYVPRFKPANEGERELVNTSGFQCAD